MKRDFKGIWIPAEVWKDERLSALDKVMLAEISSLDNEDGCFASNEYFAKFCNVSERTVSRSIGRLHELGFVVNCPRITDHGMMRVLYTQNGFNQQNFSSPPRQNV